MLTIEIHCSLKEPYLGLKVSTEFNLSASSNLVLSLAVFISGRVNYNICFGRASEFTVPKFSPRKLDKENVSINAWVPANS